MENMFMLFNVDGGFHKLLNYILKMIKIEF